MISEISPDEYAPFYEGYIIKSDGIPLIEGLKIGLQNTSRFLNEFPKNKWEFRYVEGKWTPKEILLHLIDAERVFGYRALLIVRSELPEIRGFDQDEFVLNSHANDRTIASLLSEYIQVRNSTISLFESFSEESLLRFGKANGSQVSARAIGRIIIGHEIHHITILKERYL
ncbi:MAG: DinB family protein [Flavobacteriaceae bacterium]